MSQPKLTAELGDQIAAAYAISGLFGDSCARYNVAERTGHLWLSRGRGRLKGPYHDFARLIDAASAKFMLPVTNMMRTHAVGGVIRQPKRFRYLDLHGVWRETNQAVLDSDGNPEFELVVVQPNEKVAMFLAERMRPETFGDRSRVTIDSTHEENIRITTEIGTRVTRYKMRKSIVDGHNREKYPDEAIDAMIAKGDEAIELTALPAPEATAEEKLALECFGLSRSGEAEVASLLKTAYDRFSR
jgi:hypothetical protein